MTTRRLMDEWGADRLKLAAAEARVRELEAALRETLDEMSTIQTAAALSGLPATAWAGFGGTARKVLKGGAK